MKVRRCLQVSQALSAKAQNGAFLPWGTRGREFESRRLDHFNQPATRKLGAGSSRPLTLGSTASESCWCALRRKPATMRPFFIWLTQSLRSERQGLFTDRLLDWPGKRGRLIRKIGRLNFVWTIGATVGRLAAFQLTEIFTRKNNCLFFRDAVI